MQRSPTHQMDKHCGYQMRYTKDGHRYFDPTPTVISALDRENGERTGFEYDHTSPCKVWGRMFARSDLLVFLDAFVAQHPAGKPEKNPLNAMTKPALCKLLNEKASEVYYELEATSKTWCKDLHEHMDPRHEDFTTMRRVFELLQLPPLEGFKQRKDACAALVLKLSTMRPPWYSRIWRFISNKVKGVFGWVKQNPKKSLLLAAALLAGLYFAPQIGTAVSKLGPKAWKAIQHVLYPVAQPQFRYLPKMALPERSLSNLFGLAHGYAHANYGNL